MESRWEVGKKVYINGSGHMPKMAAMLPSKIFYRTNSPLIMKLGIKQYVLKLYKVYINDDSKLTFTYLYKTMSNLAKLFCTYIRSIFQVSVYRTIGPLFFSLLWQQHKSSHALLGCGYTWPVVR